jgi:Tol biopolymer transport system component
VIGTLLFIGMMAILGNSLPGRIAYATSSGIMTVAPDGSDPTLVAGTGPGDTDPAWAPDASSLVYRSASGLRLAAVADGASQGQLTEGNDFSPAWSPDGTTIAFASDRGGSPLQIYLVPAGGGDVFPVRPSHFGVEEHDPTWSPDSSRLVFASGTRESRELFVYDGSAFDQLTFNGFDDVDPAWSPDGQSIVFASSSSGNFDIWRVNVNGSGLTPLTSGPAVDHDPAWSPDGRAIAFSRSDGTTSQIVVLMLETGEESQIGEGSYPTWR